jgi:hypothetical protein
MCWLWGYPQIWGLDNFFAGFGGTGNGTSNRNGKSEMRVLRGAQNDGHFGGKGRIGNGKGHDEIQGSFHYGGKSATFGRDDV